MRENDVSRRSAYCNLGMRLPTSRELLFLSHSTTCPNRGRSNAPCYYLRKFWTELSHQISRVSQVWLLISVDAQAEFQPFGYHRKMLKVHSGSDALVLGDIFLSPLQTCLWIILKLSTACIFVVNHFFPSNWMHILC